MTNNYKFEEQYALAGDLNEKEKLLSGLIAGSPDYYFYNTLHLLNVDPRLTTDPTNKKKFDKLMVDWSNDHHAYDSTLYHCIENRASLLSFDGVDSTKTQKTFQHIENQLGLTFHYSSVQQSVDTADDQAPEQTPSYPTTLDEKLIDTSVLVAQLLKNNPNEVYGFDRRAFPYLANNYSLSQPQVKALLQRIDAPMLDKPVELLVQSQTSFNSVGLYQRLTVEQMDRLVKQRADLLDIRFVQTYLDKLQPPNDDVNWSTDREVREQYLKAAFKFVGDLPDSFNSHKMIVLHHYLQHQIQQSIYDKDKFQKYIQLPRSTSYYTSEITPGSSIIRFNESINSFLTPISQDNDEKLIKKIFEKIFINESNYTSYSNYFRVGFLKPLFAEIKLLANAGDMDKWYQMVDDHATVQQLKDRVDIEFATDNQVYYHPDDNVEITCMIKNVQHLLVKVFELSTFNYYKEENKFIDSSINLDGLVANQEFTYNYSEPSIQRVQRKFTFDQLKGRRGIFVIEFIGSGKSSRALIRKGELNYIDATNQVGQVIKVIDEDGVKILKSAVYMDGHRFTSDEKGDVVIPFTPGSTASKNIILIADDGFASLKQNYQHRSESYLLCGGIFMDNSTFLQGERAPITVRARLYLGSTQIPLSNLEESILTITATDNSEQSIVTNKEVKPFVLTDNQESVYWFNVPENVDKVQVNFEARIKVLSKNNSYQTVSFSQSLAINTINQSDQISNCYLRNTTNGYKLYMLGKGGEPLIHKQLTIQLKHWMINDLVSVLLCTDKQGIINLGHLSNIELLTVYTDRVYNFNIKPNHFNYPVHINVKSGDLISIPYHGNDKTINRSNFGLFETIGGLETRDYFNLIQFDKEKNEIILKLTPGKFKFIINTMVQATINLDVCDGDIREGFIVGSSKILSYHPNLVRGLNFTSSIDKTNLTIHIKNLTQNTRVHILSSYFIPSSLQDSLVIGNTPTLSQTFGREKSNYFSGRSLGDEITYILNRKMAKNQLPGNSLKKPSLILQPWSVAKTSTKEEVLNRGEDYDSQRMPNASRSMVAPITRKGGVETQFSSFLEFLKNPSTLLTNLVPNKDGTVVVPLASIVGGGQYVNVAVVDIDSVVSNQVHIGDESSNQSTYFKDTKLVRSLDSTKHFTEKKLITPVDAGQEFSILNADSAVYTTYDTIGKALSLAKTIASSPTLQEFSFVDEWSTMTNDQKKEKFSKYYCHELAFFIYKKDKEFFDHVVLPYVQCKMHKTFIDYYLVRDLTVLETFISSAVKLKTLNTFEKILLAEVFPSNAKAIETSIVDQVNFQPLTAIRYDKLFKFAISLDVDKEPGEASSQDFEDGEDGHDSEMELCADEEATLSGGDFGGGGYGAVSNMMLLDSRMKESESEAPMMSKKMAAPMLQRMAAPMAFAPAGAPPPPAPGGYADDIMSETRKRVAPAQLYQQLEKTEEWAETNYYHIQRPSTDLVRPNEFWRDYIQHVVANNNNNNSKPFLSKYIGLIAGNLTSTLFGLAVLDLPFASKDKDARNVNGKVTFKPTSPIIIFHQELVEAPLENDNNILVSQHFFDPQNRYSYDASGEQNEIYVSQEFLSSKVYGALIVLANFSSKQRKIDVLLQVPKGAVPVGPHPFYTRGRSVELYAYSTDRIEYFFYFPETGKLPHFPTHVTEKDRIITAVPAFVFNVVQRPTIVNQMSWEYVASNGTNQAILEYLGRENLQRINLSNIYHKLNDREFWKDVVNVLRAKAYYDQTIWSFAIHHQNATHCNDYLGDISHFDVGPLITCPLLIIDPIAKGKFQYLEYSPLVNSRTHQLGSERKILNDKLNQQYKSFINLLTYKANPNDQELLSLVYYLLAQDRYDEAVAVMHRVGIDHKPIDLPVNLPTPSTLSPSLSSQAPDANSPTAELTKEDKKKKKQEEKDEKKREKDEKKKKKEEEKEEIKKRKELEKEDMRKRKEEEKQAKKLKKQKSGDSTVSATLSSTGETVSTTIGLHHDDDECIDVLSFNSPSCLPDMQIQYDYLISYLDFFNSSPLKAKELADKYKSYPVARWSALFKDLYNKLQQIDSNEQQQMEVDDSDMDRDRRHAKMLSKEPSFDISLDVDRTIAVNYTNLTKLNVSYYIMDIELLFSSNPFVQQSLGQFLYVSPNKKESFLLPSDDKSGTFAIKLPVDFQNANILVDVESEGVHHTLSVYSNNLAVQITEKVGQLRVVQKNSKKAVPKAYVKVYAKNKSDKVEFFKDGYTDSAGFMDYTTVSTGNIADVSKFSILILHKDFGALIKESKPPQQ